MEHGRGLLRGIGSYIQSHGPWTVFHRVGLIPQQLSPQLRKWNPHGIIGQFDTPQVLRQVRRLGVPTIDLFGLHPCQGIPRFPVDNAATAIMAADYFLELGYRNYAYCGFEKLHYCRQRRDAFVDYLQQQECTVEIFKNRSSSNSSNTFEVETSGQFDIARIGSWLQSLPKPLALMAGTDMRAIQVLEACRLHHLKVPQEVAVLCVGNDEVLCNLTSPPLTSIALRSEQIGYQAAALLDQMLRGKKPPHSEIVTGPLCVVSRESTNHLAITDPQVHEALLYLREHLAHNVAISALAKHVGISPSTLQRRFVQALGRSPRDELIRLQLARIEELLRDMNFSLARIAELTGFNYAECMMKLFKRKTGLTPSEYRRQLQSPPIIEPAKPTRNPAK